MGREVDHSTVRVPSWREPPCSLYRSRDPKALEKEPACLQLRFHRRSIDDDPTPQGPRRRIRCGWLNF
jgi:hypothetical protein